MTENQTEEVYKCMNDLMLYGAYVMVLQPDGKVRHVPYRDYWEHVKKNPPAR